MRKQFLFLRGFLALLLLGLGQWSFAQRPSRAGAVRVVLQPGDVARQSGTQLVRTTAERDMPVYYQDVLETGGGGRPATPVPVLLGFSGSAAIQVSSTVSPGHTVALSGTSTSGQVTASFSPNPLTINASSSSGNAIVTLTPTANDTGADQVTVQGVADSVVVSAPLFINRIAPFTFTRTSPATLTLLAGQIPPQTGTIAFNVSFNAPFTGPVQITAPAGTGHEEVADTQSLPFPPTAFNSPRCCPRKGTR